MKYFFILLFLLLKCYAAVHDQQLWLYAFYERPLVSPWRFHFMAQGRWDQGDSRLHRRILEGEAIYPFNSTFEVAPGFRNISELDTGNQSHIPFIDFFLNLKHGKERFRNRFRPEYVVRKEGPNFWVIRNRLTWFFPTCKKKYTPYLQDEVFWRNELSFYENRIAVGTEITLKKNFSGGIFFMHRVINREARWEQDAILGLQLRYHLINKK